MNESKDIVQEDKNSCWYQQSCVDEMNRFYDAHIKPRNPDVIEHMDTFQELLKLTDMQNVPLIDMGTGSAMVSEWCKDFKYTGSDLPHILSGCAMRNYPQYTYRSCDMVNDDISWIKSYPIVTMSAIIDIMEHPIVVLKKVLKNASEYVLIHRQEITEKGETHVIQNSSYGGYTYHSIINRKDFEQILNECSYTIAYERNLKFGNWEDGGKSFLLRKKKSWALYDMDYKLDKWLGYRTEGYFIEAGANDGLLQSNTMYLEFYRNWNGILVEPLYDQYEKACHNRSKGTSIYNCGLSDKEEEKYLYYSKESSGLLGVMSDSEDIHSKLYKMRGHKIDIEQVRTRTLNSILEQEAGTNKILKLNNVHKIDLLVLDTEGYELKALEGIDLNKYNIEFMLIEELEENDLIKNYLSLFGYDRVDKLSEHDYLYKKAIQ